MSRVTSLTNMPEAQLNRWIKRIALLFFVVLIAFVAFYVFDRYNPIQQPSLVQQQVTAAEAAVQSNPADIAKRGALADLYVQVGRYQDAVTQYEAIIATGKDEELARLGRAKALEALGNVDGAAADWTWIIDFAKGGEMAAVDPNLALAYYRLGMIQLDKADYANAVTNLKASLDITKSDADTLYALGKAYTATGKLDDAISSFNLAVSFVPIGWPEPYLGLKDAYTKQGNADLAAWASAMGSMAEGDLATAEAGLKKLVGTKADDKALLGLAIVAESKGDTVAAAGYYQQVLDKDPGNPSAMLGLSRTRPVATTNPAASPAATPAASQEGSN